MNLTKITEVNLEKILKLEEIENIHFFRVNLSFLNLTEKTFTNCVFEKCNLSNTNFKDTTFNDVKFIKSKIMGVKFSEIKTDISFIIIDEGNFSISGFNFEECKIIMSCFYKMKLENMSFKESEIIDCDFTEANLEKSIFIKTNLTKTNFKNAFNFEIDPTLNFLKKTRFSPENAVLLLSHLDIEID